MIVYWLGVACGVPLGAWIMLAASGTSGSAQDAQRLDPKGAGPTPEGGDAQKEGLND